jgi:serine/threonine-protein kinase RsbW
VSTVASAAIVELLLPPDVAYVGIARLMVTLAARNSGMSSERLEDLRIAVSEATTNAVRAHQRASSDAPVVLGFGAMDHGFEVIVSDAGPGFEPADPAMTAERNWQNESGLGVTIIRGLADEVSFERGEGMRVNMRFFVALES